ncbi:ATP-grasp fold amidoligase family protein [Aquibaculum sediminis]|uniref:ATP-grasp fold amidoligase family protein n=1 Tax=Aquibaculum sediminis TaxID=3231907 RepID=UPI003456A701
MRPLNALSAPVPALRDNLNDRRGRPIDTRQPSFAYKIRESQDAWRLARQMRVVTPLQAVDHKLDGARFADALGVRPPKILGGPASLAELTPPECASFTLKPLRGTSGKGVLLLKREKSGFRDLLSKALYPTWSSACAASQRSVNHNEEFYIEELVCNNSVSESCPDDFKFYCFYGVVGVILQKKRINNKKSLYRWLNSSWEVVNTGRYVNRVDSNLPTPENKGKLLLAAERLSSSVPVPFLRIDLYADDEGAVFGEFTPHPGGFDTFSEKWDIKLGSLYEAASARLQIDLVHCRFDLNAFWSRFGRSHGP